MTNVAGDYTYSFICKCRAETYMELSKEIDYQPKCFKCNSTQLILRYTIIHGDLWMSDDLHE
jgi:hypothetical protein